MQLFSQMCTASMLWFLSTLCTSGHLNKGVVHSVVCFAEVFCSGLLVYPYSCFSLLQSPSLLYSSRNQSELHLRLAAISCGFDDHTHSQRPHGYRERYQGPEFMIGQGTEAHPSRQPDSSARREHLCGVRPTECTCPGGLAGSWLIIRSCFYLRDLLSV